MPAQLGNSILLQYGNQGAQQAGGAVLLSYDGAAGATSTRISGETKAPWVRSQGVMRPLSSIIVASDNLDTSPAMPWGASDPANLGESLPWVPSARTDGGSAAPWGEFGQIAADDTAAGWSPSARRDDERAGAWGKFGSMLNDEQGARWAKSKPADAAKQGDWSGFWAPLFVFVDYLRPAGNAANFTALGGGIDSAIFPTHGYLPPAGDALDFRFGSESYAPPVFHPLPEHYQQPAGDAAGFVFSPVRAPVLDEHGQQIIVPSHCQSVQLVPWGWSRKLDDDTVIQWLKFSRPLNPGWGVITPGQPEPPAPGETIIIPVRRFYIVVNEILLTRADDNTPIPSSDMRVSFDCDSWLPSFSATIPESARDIVMPDPLPVEVLAYINGSEFRFMVEGIARSRRFAQRSVSISGRGIACELDAPYAEVAQHTNASAMTAQQLIGAALEFTTYTQTWNITDWLVPSGALSINGTPAAVAAHVAEASGSVLAADWALRDLRMLPRYPVNPWEWSTATPDYVIPAAITETESVEWHEKPGYNLVYVSGTQAGVLGQVKRTGTAGDKPAPMVTHPLITHADAARQRGTAILGDTGRKAMMRISMPVLDTTGVIDICRMIEFSDGANTRRGIVRANEVSVQWPQVRQTLTIEAAA